MNIRPFKKCDADTIVSWIKSEKIFRYWCADRFEYYPITGNELIKSYEASLDNDDTFHFVTFDDSGLIGYFIIRYPDITDRHTVRLGFVIVDDLRRGQGIGKQMIKKALDYAVEYMDAKKVTIGVFDNNPSALYCYLNAGFKDTGVTEPYTCMGEEWTCKELVYDPFDLSSDEEGFSYNMTGEEFIMFRKAVGWEPLPVEEANKGIKNSTVVCIRKEGKPIAFGRIIMDHGYVAYIADIVVLPEYQGQGYGRKIMDKVMSIIRSNLKSGYKVMLSLSSAKGKESFYEKFGFIKRPTEDKGHGMYQWIAYEESKEI